MTDPIDEVQAISVARRSVPPPLSLDVRNTEVPTNHPAEVLSKRADLADVEGEARDVMATRSLQEKVNLLHSRELFPIRIGFVIERETRDVRIRVINARSGEIIREVPPQDITEPKSLTED